MSNEASRSQVHTATKALLNPRTSFLTYKEYFASIESAESITLASSIFTHILAQSTAQPLSMQELVMALRLKLIACLRPCIANQGSRSQLSEYIANRRILNLNRFMFNWRAGVAEYHGILVDHFLSTSPPSASPTPHLQLFRYRRTSLHIPSYALLRFNSDSFLVAGNHCDSKSLDRFEWSSATTLFWQQRKHQRISSVSQNQFSACSTQPSDSLFLRKPFYPTSKISNLTLLLSNTRHPNSPSMPSCMTPRAPACKQIETVQQGSGEEFVSNPVSSTNSASQTQDGSNAPNFLSSSLSRHENDATIISSIVCRDFKSLHRPKSVGLLRPKFCSSSRGEFVVAPRSESMVIPHRRIINAPYSYVSLMDLKEKSTPLPIYPSASIIHLNHLFDEAVSSW